MLRIGEILQAKPLTKKAWLSKATKKAFMTWALEANQIDSSRSISQYYIFFVNQLRKKYQEAKNKEDFYNEGVIET